MEQSRTPSVGEMVITRIDKVMQFSAHCKLIEYGDIDAFLPIREVSSGWIKNIHEYIHTGQIVVCKVIFIDKDKGTIDISIKKVNQNDAKEKLNTYNLEKRLTSLFQQAMKEARVSPKDQRDAYASYVLTSFSSFTRFIKSAADNTPEFEDAKLPKKLKDTLQRLIESSKGKSEHKVAYMLSMSTSDTHNGIEQIKGILSDIEKTSVEVEYIGAPRYRLIAEGPDYPTAEAHIQAAEAIIREELKDGRFSMEKEKIRKEKVDIINRL